MLNKHLLCLYLVIFIQLIFSLFFSNSSNSNFSNTYIYPTDTTYISSYFGYRNIFGSTSFHSGIDFPMPQGTNVYATNEGTITTCGFINGYGISVIISHPNGFKSLYAHLDENVNNFVKVGINVKKGDVIANVGPKYLSNGVLNGLTTGQHLHFTIYNDKGELIDPLSLNLVQK